MKTKSPLPIVAAFTTVLVTQALAIDAPADDAPPPPTQARKQALPHFDLSEPEAAPLEKTAFLGVISGNLPPLLVEHLALNHGEGVLIRSLVPGSPADQAGIAINDVITKISEKPVGSPREISAQISAHKPGESITLELIHKGHPATKEIVLGSKPCEPARPQAEPLAQLSLDGFPEELADRVRDAIAGNIGNLNLDVDAGLLPPRVDQAMQKLQLHLQGAAGQASLIPGSRKFETSSSAVIKMMDGQGCIEMKTNDGSKEVVLRDPSGNITWSGPWDTAQDKAAAPEEVRKRIEALNLDCDFNGKGLQMHLHQGPPPADH